MIQYGHQIRVFYLRLDLIIQELLLEFGQGVVGAVIVQIQRIQNIPAKDLPTKKVKNSVFHWSNKRKSMAVHASGPKECFGAGCVTEQRKGWDYFNPINVF